MIKRLRRQHFSSSRFALQQQQEKSVLQNKNAMKSRLEEISYKYKDGDLEDATRDSIFLRKKNASKLAQTGVFVTQSAGYFSQNYKLVAIAGILVLAVYLTMESSAKVVQQQQATDVSSRKV